jgi:GNAT superfamily N-acetyltransferase
VVFIAEEGAKVVSFCCGNATNPGFYGPTGTAESARGKGLARILLNKTLLAMKKDGHKVARIPWIGPIGFYAKFAGARLCPAYWQFSKKL